MPEYVARHVADALNDKKKPMSGSKILLIGLAYKPNVDDIRESPAFVLMNMLKERGAEVAYYDSHVPVIRPTREHGHWAGMKSVGWNRETVSKYDLVLIATAHKDINYSDLAEWADCIVDTRNAMAGIPMKKGRVWKS